MAADPSTFAALGLAPGASAAEVEQAYKRLIKQHHPDRAGGDSHRASEINRAYQQLRTALHLNDDLGFHDPPPAASGGWSRTIWAGTLLLLLGGGAALLTLLPKAPVPLGAPPATGSTLAADAMNQPLADAAIHAAVMEASQLARSGDEMALAARSRACFAELRGRPNAARFDRCVAFDEAVIRLQDRDPLRDRGPFSQISVTGRQWGGAGYLSGDYAATDSRLRQIRVRVELLLAPATPAIAEAR